MVHCASPSAVETRRVEPPQGYAMSIIFNSAYAPRVLHPPPSPKVLSSAEIIVGRCRTIRSGYGEDGSGQREENGRMYMPSITWLAVVYLLMVGLKLLTVSVSRANTTEDPEGLLSFCLPACIRAIARMRQYLPVGGTEVSLSSSSIS
jgi:hypothetical protein